ncbi:hypothetical protein J5N97_017182 [Dioscorea zingiberensis]|uniref:DNA-directed RNA polymerase subunit beta n=1 Tax=Dioscorea zingiberensis TaxID=325984 RepID=A0A9D5CLI2_9LILI|nr:hypothetical protein J5N97_017182 [Dioscorea zingiberensis]
MKEDRLPDLSDLDNESVMGELVKGQPSSEAMDIDTPSGDAKDLDLGINVGTLEKFCKDAARSFFNEQGLISHQINSFNEFVSEGIQKLFDSLGEVNVEPGYDPSKKGVSDWRHATFSFGKVTLEKPTFWTGNNDIEEEFTKFMPRHARLQNMTYSSLMKVEVRLQVYTHEKSDKAKTGNETYVRRKVLSDETEEMIVGRIPVMVKSNLCWLHTLKKSDCLFDYGGYFVIKGAEKAFIAQEQRCSTRLWVTDTPTWMVQYQSQFKRKRIYAKLVDAPKAEDKEIVQMIDLEDCDTGLLNIILATIKDADEQCDGFRREGAAREYVHGLIKSSKFPPSETFDECISTYLFPTISGCREKALFLGYMVKCLLLACSGKRKCDNKDDFRNKRLDLAGELLARELWVHVRHLERYMMKKIQRDLYGDKDVKWEEKYLDASIITNGLKRAFSTGLWCHPYKTTERCSGVVATLRRTNPLQMMSDLRKVRQQVAYAGKAGDARYPNPSYWGKLCFLSTPEGENCGLVKNLSVTAIISSKVTEPMLDALVSSGLEKLEDISLSSISKSDKVLLNGVWVGVCQDSSSFAKNLRHLRRKKLIHSQVEIKRDKDQREVRIFSDSGRILRPLLIVENLKKIKLVKGGVNSFQSLLDEEIVEFIGVEEEEDCRTAWGVRYLFTGDKGHPFPKYTHCELDLSFLLGLSCSIIPFANHNHARRVLFEAEKHSQQSIGFSTTNPSIRVDTLSHQLYYPQKPLFRTMVVDCLGDRGYSLGQNDTIARPEYFNGQNAIVAVNVHQGYNQEDSLVMNRTSLERGLFRTEHFRSYKAEVDNKELNINKGKDTKSKVDFGKIQSKKGRVDSLDDDGFPYIGANLQSGDIIIGKVAQSEEDHGIKLKHTEKGIVQKVVLSSNDEGKNYAVVTLRQVRSPTIGDKFSSMHGQKGVVGFLESQENFPFTCQGIVPDIVINPHAFPTRQTPGQLLEAALGKGIAAGGTRRYATPFTTPSVDVITEQLHSAGYSKWGSERVLNGRTGEMMRSLIFMGPTFYQRLIHMAEDKVKFRNTGPVHPLTRQPVADRKRFGGIKFGEMERDCLLAHGAAANLHERLFTLSDFSQMHVCQTCTRAATVIQRIIPGGKRIRGPYCRFCESAENIIKINVPYGAKLLYQELFSMGICLKFETELC